MIGAQCVGRVARSAGGGDITFGGRCELTWSRLPMSKSSSQSAASLQVVRRILALEGSAGKNADSTALGAGLQRTIVRVSESLRDSMGEDGSDALLTRALARTERDHPALKNIRGRNEGGIQVDGVAASVEAHGVAAVTAAIEALLVALVDILGRLIGEDMAIRLIDPDSLRSRNSDGAPAP